MITLPAAFVRNTITREGEAGLNWIAALPALVDTLSRRWRLTFDGQPLHGYLAVVFPVRRDDEPCMLKISWIEESTRDEPLVLSAWDGRGAVRLLDADPAQGALLLERLDHRRSLNDLPLEEAVLIAGRLLRRLAVPAPATLRPQTEVAQTISRSLTQRWDQQGRPFSQTLLNTALDLTRLIAPCPEAQIIDYDLHYENVLGGEREPWLAVDPKVISGEVAFGLAQLFWTRFDEMERERGLEHYFRLIIGAAQVDGTRARAWALVRVVDYWLWGLSVGLTEDPARCALLAERLL